MIPIKNSSLIIVLSLFLFAASASAQQDQFDMINLAKPLPNLMTAGQPSEDDLKKLAAMGTKAIINLRSEAELEQLNQKKLVESMGMQYISIPIAGSKGINLESAQALDTALNKIKGSVLLHCASSNRVGGLLAYRAFALQNKTAEEALLLGEKSGMTSSEARVRALIESSKKE